MTPASATAPRSGVEMTVMSEVSVRFRPVERGQLLAVFRRTDHHIRTPLAVFERVQVEGVQRLSEQEQT